MTPVFELNHLQVSLRSKKQNMDLGNCETSSQS